MPASDASTRDRLLDAAMELFARQGYASTSIADIQRACGLSPQSGALYKHFASKKALLRAAVRRQVEQLDTMRHNYSRSRPVDIPGALRQGADQIWAGVESTSQLLRVLFREPEAIDDMIDELWSAIASNAYRSTDRALSAAKDSGLSRVEDPEATSAVLVAALAYLPIAQLLIQRTPANIDPERFREAWLRLAESVFTGAPPT